MKDTEKTLKVAFGENWTELIELDKSRRPIGSGCIAQVYHGKLLKPTRLQPAGEVTAAGFTAPPQATSHNPQSEELIIFLMLMTCW